MDNKPPSIPPSVIASFSPTQFIAGSLPDEAAKRIVTEELFRSEVQKQLRKKDTDGSESKSIKFLNSPFGLFLLGAVFISGLGGVFQLWTEQLKQNEARRVVQKKILSEYRWRLNDLDKLISDSEKAGNNEAKGNDSLLIYRIGYGAVEYQTSLPEFKNASWGGLITQLDEFGISESAAQAVDATNVLMSGPYAGLDNRGVGYFGPGILEDRAKILHLYYDNARKKIYDTSVWRVFR